MMSSVTLISATPNVLFGQVPEKHIGCCTDWVCQWSNAPPNSEPLGPDELGPVLVSKVTTAQTRRTIQHPRHVCEQAAYRPSRPILNSAAARWGLSRWGFSDFMDHRSFWWSGRPLGGEAHLFAWFKSSQGPPRPPK